MTCAAVRKGYSTKTGAPTRELERGFAAVGSRFRSSGSRSFMQWSCLKSRKMSRGAILAADAYWGFVLVPPIAIGLMLVILGVVVVRDRMIVFGEAHLAPDPRRTCRLTEGPSLTRRVTQDHLDRTT